MAASTSPTAATTGSSAFCPTGPFPAPGAGWAATRGSSSGRRPSGSAQMARYSSPMPSAGGCSGSAREARSWACGRKSGTAPRASRSTATARCGWCTKGVSSSTERQMERRSGAFKRSGTRGIPSAAMPVGWRWHRTGRSTSRIGCTTGSNATALKGNSWTCGGPKAAAPASWPHPMVWPWQPMARCTLRTAATGGCNASVGTASSSVSGDRSAAGSVGSGVPTRPDRWTSRSRRMARCTCWIRATGACNSSRRPGAISGTGARRTAGPGSSTGRPVSPLRRTGRCSSPTPVTTASST